MTTQPPKLQAQFIATIRTLHYSRRTQEAYWHWIRAFILWSGKRHPLEMGKVEVGQFLSYLATERNVSASTQRYAHLYDDALAAAINSIGAGKKSPIVTQEKRPPKGPSTEVEARAGVEPTYTDLQSGGALPALYATQGAKRRA